MPIASMPTSMGDPWRPSTNVWCHSSLTAYASASAAAGSAGRRTPLRANAR